MMRHPNGYGTVVKLSGNRRNPFVARKTIGWNDKGHPIYSIIGYYPTRKEGLLALAEYNRNPFDINASKITMKELYEKWAEKKMPKLGNSLFYNLKAAFKHCASIHDMKYKEIRSFHMQDCIDKCGRAYSTQRSIKNLFGHLDNFALDLDVVQKCYSQLLTTESIPETSKQPFTEDEVKSVWKIADEPWVDSVLVFLYSGWRINELLALKTEDVDLENWTMKGGSKTSSGKDRIIPIHCKIQDIVKRRVDEGNVYLFSLNGRKMFTAQYYPIWSAIMEALSMIHTPHECRHTFRSRLDSAGANKVCIDLMMGHKSKEVGERVYTHKALDELREAIELVTD